MLIMRLRRGFRATLVAAAALVVTVSARADFITSPTSDEGTRQIIGATPATLIHGQLAQLTVSVTGSIQTSVDAITEFSIAPIATLPNGAVITSATLFFDISGAHSGGSPAALSVNGYGDGDGAARIASHLHRYRNHPTIPRDVSCHGAGVHLRYLSDAASELLGCE